MISATDEDESRFRSLTFKSEECRVRDGADTYVPAGGSLNQELLRLRAERDRQGHKKSVHNQRTVDIFVFVVFQPLFWLTASLVRSSSLPIDEYFVLEYPRYPR